MSHYFHRQQPHSRTKSRYKDLDPLAVHATKVNPDYANDDDTDGWTLALQQSKPSTDRSSPISKQSSHNSVSYPPSFDQDEPRSLVVYNDLSHVASLLHNDRNRLPPPHPHFCSNSNPPHLPLDLPRNPTTTSTAMSSQPSVYRPQPYPLGTNPPPNARPLSAQLPPPDTLPTLSVLSDALNEADLEPVTPIPRVRSWSNDDAPPLSVGKPREDENSGSSGETANNPVHMQMPAFSSQQSYTQHGPVLEPVQSWSDEDHDHEHPQIPIASIPPQPLFPAGDVPVFHHAQEHLPVQPQASHFATPTHTINSFRNDFYPAVYNSPSPFVTYASVPGVAPYPDFDSARNIAAENHPGYLQFPMFSNDPATSHPARFAERTPGRGRPRGRGKGRGRGRSRGRFLGNKSDAPESPGRPRDKERLRGHYRPRGPPRPRAENLPDVDRQRHTPIFGARYAPWAELPKRIRDPAFRSILPLTSKSAHVAGTSVKKQKKSND